ncbi:sensor histidine kinase [Natronococcus wangiae]|uniref:sensor histidine kinase n=1 Tax=Natronococcus wangiae TaxID=3068275 RepID=UPI00273DF193|nr:ATP-binding protein [Natronococcus sp. AD5]
MSDRSELSAPLTAETAADVYDRISDAVFALDEEWRFTYLNERAEDMLRRSEEELLGRNVWEAFPGAAGSTFQREYERAMETQEAVSFEEFYEPLDAWLEVRAYPSENGLSVYFRDITARVERENELRRRERALRRTYEIVADPDRTFPEQVDALLETVRDAVGTDYATLSRVHEDADEYIFEKIAVPEGVDLREGDAVSLSVLPNCATVVRTERTLVLEDVAAEAPELVDPEFGIACYLGAPVTVDGEVYGTFCFYGTEARSEAFTKWDVTFVELLSNWVSYELERERRERELEASNERLEQFAYTVSHDLQEPLRMVSSYLQLIERRYEDEFDEDGREFLAYAVDGADRMGEMIDALLAYSRIETQGQEFEPVDLDAVIEDVLDDLQLQLRETDAAVSAESLPRVEGDRDQLRQVFQNLVENAIVYCGDEPPEIEIVAERDDERCVISVSDDGIGIDPDETDRIFEIFERLHGQEEHDGTGIGLALCERIVERHGGEIRVDSEPGGGSTFSFTLPAADATDE